MSDVYVLERDMGWDGTYTIGRFSTKERAESHRDKLIECFPNLTTEDFIVYLEALLVIDELCGE